MNVLDEKNKLWPCSAWARRPPRHLLEVRTDAVNTVSEEGMAQVCIDSICVTRGAYLCV